MSNSVPYKHVPVAGTRYGRLVIIQRVADDNVTKSQNLKVRVRVECTCGVRLTIPFYYLIRKSPKPKSKCGTCDKSIKTLNNLTYRSWYMAHVRTEDTTHIAYKDYGGRGIKVCDEWHKPDDNIPMSLDNLGFERFVAYLKENNIGTRPSVDVSLDRFPNNDGNYEPGNVRWATPKEQRANQRPRQ